MVTASTICSEAFHRSMIEFAANNSDKLRALNLQSDEYHENGTKDLAPLP